MPKNDRPKQNGYLWRTIVTIFVGILIGVAVQSFNVLLTNKVEQDTKKVLKAKINRENEIKKERLDEELAIGKKRLDEDYQAWSDTMSPIFSAKLDSFKNSFPNYAFIKDDPNFKARYLNFKKKNIDNKKAIKKREIERKKEDLERKIKEQKEDLDMLLDF